LFGFAACRPFAVNEVREEYSRRVGKTSNLPVRRIISARLPQWLERHFVGPRAESQSVCGIPANGAPYQRFKNFSIRWRMDNTLEKSS
jgi:hypothetical protein